MLPLALHAQPERSPQATAQPAGVRSFWRAVTRVEAGRRSVGVGAQTLFAVLAAHSSTTPPTAKSVRKLKEQLLRPDSSRIIVLDLRRLELPAPAPAVGHLDTVRGFALPLLDEAGSLTTGPTPTCDPILERHDAPFDLLADASGALIRTSQFGLVAPFDRAAVFLYWWGFEITLPTPALASLSKAHSIQNTFFGCFAALIITGGAPELAPYLQYISTYLDMEFKAIQAQDHDHGVVLAGTWVLPVALVPRPWDFPLPPPVKKW